MAENLKNILEGIRKSDEMTFFFRNLWKENSTQARLFFLHREQLFPFEEKVIIPCLFWSKVQTKKERRILDITTELEEIKGQQALEKLGFEKLFNGIKDLIAYAIIKVIRKNAGIKKLVSDKTFSFRKMKKILGDYSQINFDVLKQEEIENVPELDSIVKANVLKFVKTFDPLGAVEAISSTFGFAKILPLMGIPHLEKVLEITEIGFDDYTDILNRLYVSKLINNFQTLFWCEYCLDTPQVFISTSRIDPDHLKMKCLKCRKQMSVSSIYNINGLLKDCILFRDGLLAVALGWLFDQKKVTWDFSVHNQYENDFICETKSGKILFECKMHLLPKDERSFRGQVKQDLTLLITHVKTLAKEGTHLNKVYLVFNYDLQDYPSDWLENILNLPKLSTSIKHYNIEVIGFPDVAAVLDEQGYQD
jgi:hypothetical protein